MEGGGLDTLGGLNSEVDLVDGAEDLVDLTDGRLILEEDLRVELRDLVLRAHAAAHHLALAGVQERAHLEDRVRRAEVALAVAAAACRVGEVWLASCLLFFFTFLICFGIEWVVVVESWEKRGKLTTASTTAAKATTSSTSTAEAASARRSSRHVDF